MEKLEIPGGEVLSDNYLVKETEANTKTGAGIIIPNAAQKRTKRGTILKVGPGFKDVPMTLQVGTVVLYGEYTGTEIELEGEEYLLMRQTDILYVLPTEEKES